MKLKLLLEREPFADILIETLRAYLQEEYSWKGSIAWKSARPPFRSESLLANGELNVIYPASLPRYVLRSMTREYAYHENPLRHLLQRTYVRFATSFPMEWFTTTAVIIIDPWPEMIKKCCIVPGNHSLRIIELDRNLCRVISKNGFNREFIQAEVSLRQIHTNLLAPKLVDVGNMPDSYSEERIEGLPLGRIPDLAKRDATITRARQSLCRLYSKTRRSIKIRDWLNDLRTETEMATKDLPCIYSPSYSEQILALHDSLAAISWADGPPMVQTVVTHGDFQGANILADADDKSERIHIIDWEYTGRRFYLYDALVFSAGSRFPAGLGGRLHSLLADHGNLPDWRWCIHEIGHPKKLERWMIAAFLLEDLLVRLKEQSIPGLKVKSEGLMQFITEVREFVSG